MMKYKSSQWTTEPAILEHCNEEYVVEIGTYLPIKKRVEDLKQAGMDLMAYRQAYADFANGTRELDLDDYDDELMGVDEIDFLKKKQRYLEIMSTKEKLAKEALAKEEARKAELIQKGLEAEKTVQKSFDSSTSSDA